MKKLLYTLAAVLVSSLGMSQTYTENFVKTTTYQVETTTGSVSTDDKIEAVTYYDGLGRPMQSVSRQAGGNKQDIITPIVYDEFGRQVKEYLPYVDPNQTSLPSLDYRTMDASFFTSMGDYYQSKYPEDINGSSLNPYSEKRFEASPLNRVLEQGAPGVDWSVDKNTDNDHTIKFEYGANTDYDYVRSFGVSFPTGNTELPELEDKGFYEANLLYKTVTKDENWSPAQSNFAEHTTEEYKDKQGRVVLKRTFDRNKWLDTYYVYDDFGNLTYVLPPKAVTLNSVLNPYSGDLGFDGDISNMFVTPGGTAEYIIWDTNDGFSVLIDAISFTEGTKLKSGKIADLDFSPYAPPLMGVTLGNIVSHDANGNSEVAAVLYVKDGDLYLDSTGAEFYTITGLGNYMETFYVDISNYIPNTIDPNILKGLCYQYKYDHRNRLVEKQLPGKDKEYIVYNKLDQPILTQDANLRAQDKWLFTKYDAFGRVAYTGEYINSIETSRSSIQSKADADTFMWETPQSNTIAGESVYYTNEAFPDSGISLYTINYYDNYDFNTYTIPEYLENQEEVVNHDNMDKLRTKGLSTGSKVKVLGTSDWITTVTGYDKKGRAIYVKSINDYLGTTDIVETHLDFTGKVQDTKSTHFKSGETISETNSFSYDHMGRLLSQSQKINNLPEELIVQNIYDELGQLKSKGVGGKITEGRLQSVDYKYNIRGWLKQINDPANPGNDLFTFKLNYNTSEQGSTPLYNGNISETSWRTANSDNQLKWYKYSYDALNRLQAAVDNDMHYVEAGIFYDKNGNIDHLLRLGYNENTSTHGMIDNLSYVYESNSNKLIGVSDVASATDGLKTFGFNDGNTVGNDYEYDANGNMTKDQNKGVTSISYNHLNLPDLVSINDGATHNGNIKYIYDATGVKLEKKVTKGTDISRTLYAGNYVYSQSNQNVPLELKFFNHPEGYIEPKVASDLSQGFDYVYQFKDHLGNVRLSYKDINKNYQSIINSDFESSFDGWEENGDVDYTLENGRLKANVRYSWEGVRKPLQGVTTVAGETLTVKIDFDKGDTESPVRLYLPEYDSSGNLVRYNMLKGDLQSGYSEHTLTMIDTGNSISHIRIDKNNTNTDKETYFYLNHVTLVRNDLEILEENNYYPFGLEHKGYNKDNITSTNIALKKKFAGEEFEDELGKNTVAFQWRDYDPAIGRFNKIDRFAEKYYAITPYHFAANNPIFFKDIKGDSIQGTTRKDARKARRLIRQSFKGKGRGKLRRLFRTSGKNFDSIDDDAFANATQNLSDDEKALANGYKEAINSKEVHEVEIAKAGKGRKVMGGGFDGGVTVDFMDNVSGGGFNRKTSNGSYSLIIENSKAPTPDMRDNSNGNYLPSAMTDVAQTLAHELLGHGLTRYNQGGNQHINAIQMSNLYLRVKNNGSSRFYRDGSRHSGAESDWNGNPKPIPGTISWQIPLYLK